MTAGGATGVADLCVADFSARPTKDGLTVSGDVAVPDVLATDVPKLAELAFRT